MTERKPALRNPQEFLCPDCGHHLHRPQPGACQWHDCRCGNLDLALETIENVLTGMDWLGTGSSIEIADEEEREAWQAWDTILTALDRPSNSHARVYGEPHDDQT